MAEALFNKHCGEVFQAESAGLEAGTLNPLAVEVLQEIGIDISHKTTQEVFEVVKRSELFAYVFTVCDAESAEQCPIFPGVGKRVQWDVPDPSGFTGTREERLAKTREVRDLIDAKVSEWCESVCPAISSEAHSG